MQKWRKTTGEKKRGKKKGIYVETCICRLDLCTLIYIEIYMPLWMHLCIYVGYKLYYFDYLDLIAVPEHNIL